MVRLARRCRPPQRRQLVTKLKERNDVVKDPSARAALVASFPEFSNADNLYGVAMAMAIGQIDREATKELLTLPESEQAKLLKLAEPTVQSWIDTAKEKADNPPEGEEPENTASVNAWLLPALQVLEDSAVAVTRLAVWLLRAGNPQSDTEVQSRLNLLAPVRDPELLRLILQRMRTVPLGDREAWLDAIDPSAVDTDAVAELDATARQVCSERMAPEADPASFSGILDHLAAFAKELPVEERSFPRVDAAIGEATQSPMDSEGAAQEFLRISAAANEFVDHELADTTQCADRFIAGAASAIPGLPIGELDQLPQLRSAVSQLLDDWLVDASPAALQALREAWQLNPEAPLDATKAEALLGATGRLRKQGEEISPPLDATAIGELGREHGEGQPTGRSSPGWLSSTTTDSGPCSRQCGGPKSHRQYGKDSRQQRNSFRSLNIRSSRKPPSIRA